MGFFDRFKKRQKRCVMRDSRPEVRDIVALLARGVGIFSTCADTISRSGRSFNPNYEAVSTALGLVFDATGPLEERLSPFIVGLYRGDFDITGADTEIQFCLSLWSELKYLFERLARVANESAYAAARDHDQPSLWDLAQALRYLDAAAQVCVRLHFANLDKSGDARELTLQQLREFVSPKLIDDWASVAPTLRRKADQSGG